MKILQYFHDQLVLRLHLIQDAFDRREFGSPTIDAVQHEVDRITVAAEVLEAAAQLYGHGVLADMFDTLGYAGRESGMGAPFKGLAELTRLQQLATLQSPPEVP